MTARFFDLPGDVVAPDTLAIRPARNLALALQEGRILFARLVECRRNTGAEVVVFDVEVEVPQIRVRPVLPTERVAASFSESDASSPRVFAMRQDFPEVPHLNLLPDEAPRCLCIHDQRQEELVLQWTAQRFVRSIRGWLALTAKGELHQGEQQLEPFLLAHAGHIVLPTRLCEPSAPPESLMFVDISSEPGKHFLRELKGQPQDAGRQLLVSVHTTPPRTHGIIHRTPTSLAGLAELAKTAQLDLLSELRERLKGWRVDGKVDLASHLVLIVLVPQRRSEKEEAESVEAWAFILDDDLETVGTRLDLWQRQDEVVCLLVNQDPLKCGDDVRVSVLNVTYENTQSRLAAFSGDKSAEAVNIVAIGLGALGSQLLMNLARRGFGRWTLVDHDALMPHNLARHVLDGRFVGFNKAQAVALLANSLIGEADLFSPLAADLLAADGLADEVHSAMRDADTILDMSTSVAVARRLSCDFQSDARRVSVFMAPSGRDLILLAEDQQRAFRLDALEMQYYRAVANCPQLNGHLVAAREWQRYGYSCRDISSSLPQDSVALHAAIGARAFTETLSVASARIVVWRVEPSGTIGRVDVPLADAVRFDVGNWTLVTDEGFLDKVADMRQSRLPNETGGVLIGSFDLQRNVVYLVDALPSPPDSEEWPTLYIRGSKGLKEAVEAVGNMAHGMLEYVGEWHSHPEGASTAPSGDDLIVFGWLTSIMDEEGLPAVMMIVGDPGRVSCFVGEVARRENLIPCEPVAGGRS